MSQETLNLDISARVKLARDAFIQQGSKVKTMEKQQSELSSAIEHEQERLTELYNKWSAEQKQVAVYLAIKEKRKKEDKRRSFLLKEISKLEIETEALNKRLLHNRETLSRYKEESEKLGNDIRAGFNTINSSTAGIDKETGDLDVTGWFQPALKYDTQSLKRSHSEFSETQLHSSNKKRKELKLEGEV
ncbi:hypothetical protein GLAREA_11686 [Glarea lozoyensis ATCC 20868]|uniref:Uncharacterized protein n=1 Tax=Glarea lozoyensis (strain ATCC 20868 / MF5171) TaxID=1116229 RepID=S3CGU0_GLAL2|nr:uncharacterized protein GLAREA_11686 [Glarea lozoyensis ATCC 20868]EPE25105.1 hypothetical protein GLAREA_11686 [Glarea lozoyensis ATCC 20868]